MAMSMMNVCKLPTTTVYVYVSSIPMQEVPALPMSPHVNDLIPGPFLPVADHMCMLIFVLYNQGTIMVQLPSFPSNDPFLLSVCPGIQSTALRDYTGECHSR